MSDKKTEREKLLLDCLRDHGETSVANLGRLLVSGRGGQNSNPGTLAATSILRSLEKRGLVKRRNVTGPTFNRTVWSLVAETHDQKIERLQANPITIVGATPEEVSTIISALNLYRTGNDEKHTAHPGVRGFVKFCLAPGLHRRGMYKLHTNRNGSGAQLL